MCMRFYINTSIRDAFPGPPMWSRHPPLAVWSLGLPLHGDRDRAVVELDPCDFDWIHDPARHVDEDRRSHADLERPRSDNASLFKSRVTHRCPSHRAAGEGVDYRSGGTAVGGPNRVPVLQPCLAFPWRPVEFSVRTAGDCGLMAFTPGEDGGRAPNSFVLPLDNRG